MARSIDGSIVPGTDAGMIPGDDEPIAGVPLRGGHSAENETIGAQEITVHDRIEASADYARFDGVAGGAVVKEASVAVEYVEQPEDPSRLRVVGY